MIVAGIMSGTSADGINVALLKIAAKKSIRFQLLGHAEFPYPKLVRAAILALMNANSAKVADLARMNFLLGELYAEAIQKTQKKFHIQAELIGCHGQTLYHQGTPEKYLGRKLAVTWQTGEGAILANRLGIPVVSDFRVADMAAGGKGAPLVPFLDFILFRHPTIGRIALNIGGIANITAIPAGATQKDVIAFDTGPGNMVIDALAQRFLCQPYDRNGEIAAHGLVYEKVLFNTKAERYFRTRPPKTAGREQFGTEFVDRFVEACRGGRKQDIITTATVLTAFSISDAIERFVPLSKGRYQEVIVSGGGLKNATLMGFLEGYLSGLDLRMRSSDDLGLPSEAKEAAAFALMAYETWNKRTSNVPSATGAKKPAILGKISYA